MIVSIVRHAESIYNEKGLFQGRTDCDLSKKGYNDTIIKSKEFDSNSYDLCFSSPLKRAMQTAQILTPNLHIISDNRLIERSLGVFENTKITKEKLFILNNKNYNIDNIETIDEMEVRVKDFLKYIKDKYHDKKVLIVTHAGVIYVIQKLLNLGIKELDNLEVLNVDID